MGSTQSSPQQEDINNVNENYLDLGVATLVREVGLSLIPVHIKQTLDSVLQVLGKI